MFVTCERKLIAIHDNICQVEQIINKNSKSYYRKSKPINLKPTVLIMNNEALILIEAQNEWLSENGKLRGLIEDQSQLKESVKNLKLALDHARERKMNVVHAGLRYYPGYPELGVGKMGLRKAIQNAGTFPVNGKGSAFYEGLKPLEGEFIVSGRIGSSAFSGSNLDIYLRNNHIDTIYLTGYAMHVCVESTLREAHDIGYNPILISDASAAFTSEQKQHVLNQVVHHLESILQRKNLQVNLLPYETFIPVLAPKPSNDNFCILSGHPAGGC